MSAYSVPLERGGTHPLRELRGLLILALLIRRLGPDVVHLVTLKPVLYGGVIARMLRVPAVVSAVAGLGSVFTTSGFRSRILRTVVALAYRVALGHRNQRVMLQNTSDRDTLIKSAGLREEKVVMVRGSGVDLTKMPFRKEDSGVPIVAFAARLLRQKGVEEFVAAARVLLGRSVSARFWLIGDPDPGSPYSIATEQVEAWAAEGVVEVLGYRPNVPELYALSHVVTLPSYYGEGLPKTLIEAAACGRPIVTTDHPGCRDAIVDGETGLLVPVRNVKALADALQLLLEEPERRKAMGCAGRELAEREFTVENVVDVHMEVYRCLHEECDV